MKIRIEQEVMEKPCVTGIRVYVNGERVYRVYEINTEENLRERLKREIKGWKEERTEYRVKRYVEFEADAEIEWMGDGNKRVNLKECIHHGKQ